MCLCAGHRCLSQGFKAEWVVRHRPEGRLDLLLHIPWAARTLSLQELLDAFRLICLCRVPIDVEPTQLEYLAIFRPERPTTVQGLGGAPVEVVAPIRPPAIGVPKPVLFG